MTLPFTVGIEIETGNGTVPASALPESWLAGTDASCGLEFKSGIIKHSAALVDEVTSVCRKLSSHVRLNSKCGLHVHIGFKGCKDLSAKYRLFRFASRYEEAIFRLVRPSDTRAEYCKRLSLATWECMKTGKGFKGFETGGRYWWFNGQAMEKYGTIEFRIMNGSLNSEEILGWVSFLLCMFNATVNLDVKVPWERPEVETPEELIANLAVDRLPEFGERARQFVINRW